MAPRVDDPGVRQDQVDQTDVPAVVGHLVDEERAAEFPVDACRGQEFLSQGRCVQSGVMAASRLK